MTPLTLLSGQVPPTYRVSLVSVVPETCSLGSFCLLQPTRGWTSLAVGTEGRWAPAAVAATDESVVEAAVAVAVPADFSPAAEDDLTGSWFYSRDADARGQAAVGWSSVG